MAPTHGLKPGQLKDPKVAALFSTKDPEARFDDLKEIGHGSFGAVFYAFDRERAETVAIKKMAYHGNQGTEKWVDIIKEVTFLTSLRHPNIVEYRLSFLKDHTCWLVMEYCIGSTADLVDVLRAGLREMEIAAITHCTLEALAYLHSLGRIHRDVKAANILLTDCGIVKLADFGSASLSSPAHTFIGTPFFMAPEVILAMDDGDYNEKSDIWSLGITCIELAERRPPLFNMNAMSALYHIAQNEPPTLGMEGASKGEDEWSELFHSFIQLCLRKDPKDRISTNEAREHEFVRDLCAPPVLCDLIARAKSLVRELEHSQYRKMRKLMYLDEANADEGSDDTPGDSLSAFDGAESLGGGGSSRAGADSPSSRSASLNSSHSRHSTNKHSFETSKPTVVNVSEEEEPKEATAVPVVELSIRSIKDDVATLRKSKFSTLRTTKLITREQEEYKADNNMHEQMNGYKRLRQNHHKEIMLVEERQRAESENLKLRLDREMEMALAAALKERARLREKHVAEMEKRRRDVEEGEKRLRKQTAARQQTELKAFASCMLKEYKNNKELRKQSLKDRGLSKAHIEAEMKEVKADLAKRKEVEDRKFEYNLRLRAEGDLEEYRKNALAKTHEIENRIDAEECELELRLMDARARLHWAQHEQTAELEMTQHKELAEARARQQRTQHEAETANQAEYERRTVDALSKKHALQNKQQPRELKVKEQMIRKQYRQAVKTQTRQFKLWQTQLMAAAAREEQKEISSRLKDEQKRKLALLGVQYESQIESMVQEKTGKLEAWQEEEVRTLNEKLSKENKELRSYQATQKAQLEADTSRARRTLGERLSTSKMVLERRIEEMRGELAMEGARADERRRQRQHQERDALHASSATTTAL